MVVLDSDILIGVMKENQDAINFLDRLEKKGERLNTTTINAYELFEGAFYSSDEKIMTKTDNLLKSLGSFSFNGPASWKAAKISAELKKSGNALEFQDIAIASIAISAGEALVTRNTKHFSRIKELGIEKW